MEKKIFVSLIILNINSHKYQTYLNKILIISFEILNNFHQYY